MDVRQVVRGLGRTLIAAGVLILLFIAYQLWGTGLAEARSQDRLTEQFTETLEAPAAPPDPAVVPPPPPAGDAIAIIKIPKLGVEKAVVEGVGLEDLKKGPGHYPTTPLPGQQGNSAIAGHRTTYGAPFFRLDELGPRDPILITTKQGDFRYEVVETMVVKPTQTEVLDDTPDDSRLTLTTCHPRYSAAERLVVVASLVGNAQPATERHEPKDPQEAKSAFEEDQAGLSGRGASNEPAIAWGSGAALVWLFTWWVGRRWRRLPAYLVGTPVFLVVLFFFFENFSRLLPSNF